MGGVLEGCGLLLDEIVAMEKQLPELPAHLRGGLVGMDRGRRFVVTKPYLVKQLEKLVP